MKTINLKKRILIPLSLALTVLLGSFIFNVYSTQHKEISENMRKQLQYMRELLKKVLHTDRNIMGASINMLARNQQIQAAWLAENRAGLQKLALPLLTDLRTRHRITRFSFHHASRINFLRVHKPQKHGDIINHLSILEAKKFDKPYSGIELDQSGRFILRVVHPWHINNKVVGFIEIGKEIEQIIKELSDILGVELYVILHKEFLVREKWERRMEMLGRQSKWDRFPSSMIVSQTLEEIPEEISRFFPKENHKNMEMLNELEASVENRLYRVGFIPIYDTLKNGIGDIVVLYDVTKQLASSRYAIKTIIVICIVVGLVLLVLFSMILERLERQLASSHLKVIEESNAREAAQKQYVKEIEHERKALGKSEERTRLIVEHALDAVITINERGLVTGWNKSAEVIFGWSHAEISGKSISSTIIPTQYRKAYNNGIKHFIKTGQGPLINKYIEITALHRDGHEFPIELCVASLGRLENKFIFTAFVRNVTERKKAEKELTEHRQHLQKLVNERTAELTKTNKQLKREITERKQAEEKIKKSREDLRNLSDHLQSVKEEERTRIAREIHDELGQLLTALQTDLSYLSIKLSKEKNPLLERIQKMSKLIEMSIKTVQEISSHLRPYILDELGIVPAIEWYAEEFQTRMGIKCMYESNTEDIALDDDRSIVVFRIFQEALTNIARHANATLAETYLKKENDRLILKIKDNGKGISEKEVSSTKSFGIIGIRERAHSVGGKVKIEGIKDKGTSLTIDIPIH